MNKILFFMFQVIFFGLLVIFTKRAHGLVPPKWFCEEPYGVNSATQETWPYVYPTELWRHVSEYNAKNIYTEDLKISELTILGTFNSPLYSEKNRYQTQATSITQQISRGVRALHIIIKRINNRNGKYWTLMVDNDEEIEEITFDRFFEDINYVRKQITNGVLFLRIDLILDNLNYATSECMELLSHLDDIHRKSTIIYEWNWSVNDTIHQYNNSILLIGGKNMDCAKQIVKSEYQSFEPKSNDFQHDDFIRKLRHIYDFHIRRRVPNNIQAVDADVFINDISISKTSLILPYASGLLASYKMCQATARTFDSIAENVIDRSIQERLPLIYDAGKLKQLYTGTNEFITTLLEEEIFPSFHGLYILYTNFYGPRLLRAIEDHNYRRILKYRYFMPAVVQNGISLRMKV